MKKIISLFARDYDGGRTIRNEVVPGAEWVLAGEGEATVKFDGTCCMVRDGVLYKRYDTKKGKTPPPYFLPAQEPDAITGHWPGWVPVGDGPDDQWHREAILPDGPANCGLLDGTYELLGPKVQGNIYGYPQHLLLAHGCTPCGFMARTFDGIREYLSECVIEGIVFWRDLKNPDCDKVKIKRRDFGFEWPPKKETK